MVLSKSGTRKSPKPENKLPKVPVFLEHACYMCGNILSSAKQTINHVRRIHGIEIPTRPVGRKRPQSHEYEYIRDQSEPHDRDDYACPSCWFHAPEEDGLDALNQHTLDEHFPVKVDESKDDTGYISGASGVSASSSRGDERRRSSVQSTDSGRRGSTVSAPPDSSHNHDMTGRRGSTTSARPIPHYDHGNSGESSISSVATREISNKLDELTELFRQFFKQE